MKNEVYILFVEEAIGYLLWREIQKFVPKRRYVIPELQDVTFQKAVREVFKFHKA